MVSAMVSGWSEAVSIKARISRRRFAVRHLPGLSPSSIDTMNVNR